MLASSGERIPPCGVPVIVSCSVPSVGEDTGLQKRLHQAQDALVSDSGPHSVHQSRHARFRRSTPRCLRRPPTRRSWRPAGGSRRSRRALSGSGESRRSTGRKSASQIGSSTSFSAACTTRSRTVGMPSRRSLPLAFGIIRSRTAKGTNRQAFRSARSSARKTSSPRTAVMERAVQPSTPAVRAPLLPLDPRPCHQQERRVTDEVEQIIKPTIGVVVCPSVQLGLDPQYPPLEPLPGSATARRCSPTTSWHPSPSTADTLPPFALWPAFPASDYYEGSAPPRDRQPTTGLPATDPNGRWEGGSRDGSHVHHEPFDGIGAQLFPCSLATGTPQTFPVASMPTERTSDTKSPIPTPETSVHC